MLVTITGVATGGRGVGREPDGRVVFVEGALPGEQVDVEIVSETRRHSEGVAKAVLSAHAGRRLEPCPAVAAGCGGCDLSHAYPTLQRDLKRSVVLDCLTRIAKVATLPDVGAGPDLATVGFRTTLRAAVDDGRAGIRARRSHRPIIGDACPVAHPLVEELLVTSRFRGADEVTLRCGARTGERLVVTSGPSSGVDVPPGVVVVSEGEGVYEGEGASGGGSAPAVYHELVGGHRFRISARSFFQSRADGADALVALVGAGVVATVGPSARVVDLCGGVGLFAATVPASEVTLVESSRSATADASVNAPHARVVRSRVERWRPAPADLVIADPPRAGLGAVGVAKVAETGAEAVVLVSCDPASMARDVGLLRGTGFRLDSVTLVDLFPDTHHVETVSVLTR